MDFPGILMLLVLIFVYLTREGAVADTLAFALFVWFFTHPDAVDRISQLILGY